jgi:GT2 family glycosyltransferase
MKCSVVIPTKDKLTRLFLTLRCMEPQITPDVEVIVVFDGCTSDTIERFKEFAWTFSPKCVVSEKNLGRATARNLGLHHASGDVVIFLDDDRLTEHDFIEKHLAHHEKEKCVVLGERMDSRLREEEINRLICDSDLKTMLAKVYKNSKKEFYYSIKKLFVSNPSCSLRYIAFITGNVSVDRSLLLKLNGFDERFKGWGYEDTDLGYRLVKENIQYIQDDNIVCYHILHSHVKGQKSKEELSNLKYLKTKFPNEKGLQRAIVFYKLKATLKL